MTGIMLVILFGPSSVVGTILARNGWEVIYHKPGIVLALLFVTYPFVVRSVQPVLLELDRAEEEAAATLGAGPLVTFFRVTLPALARYRERIGPGVQSSVGRSTARW